MHLTANQTVQLLWMHFCEPSSQVDLAPKEVRSLTLDLVLGWDSLVPSVYVSALKTTDKEELIDQLLVDPSRSIFKPLH